MKIAIDGYEANVQQRVGSGQVAFELLRNIYELDLKNHYLVFLPSAPLGDLPKERDNFRYKVLRPKKLWTRIALPLALYSAPEKPNVFFSPTHYGPKFMPKKIKEVITIFDLAYLHFPQMYKKDDLYKLINWTKESVIRADRIITISKSTKADLVEFLKADPKKIVVAYPGYNSNLYHLITDSQKIEATKKKYQISGKYVIYLGTVQPRKNLSRLIEAVSRIEDIKLVVVGKSGGGQGRKAWGFEETLNKPKELGIEERVVFTGFVPEEDVPFLLAGAEGFVLPSFYEGFGITVLEAMACGVPAIVSNTSSLPEVAGKAGVLVDPYSVTQIEQAIRVLLTDKKMKVRLIKEGLKRVKKFSWKKMAKEVIKVFEEVE